MSKSKCEQCGLEQDLESYKDDAQHSNVGHKYYNCAWCMKERYKDSGVYYRGKIPIPPTQERMAGSNALPVDEFQRWFVVENNRLRNQAVDMIFSNLYSTNTREPRPTILRVGPGGRVEVIPDNEEPNEPGS